MDAPPIIPIKPPSLPAAKKPFVFQAAQASILAPAISIVTSIIINSGGQLPPLARGIAGISCILLILLGFIFGIIALFGIRRYGKRGILGRAIAGLCINGILIVFMIASIPMYKKMAERAKEMQRQKMEQQQPQP
jgi:hypothetical protein